MRIFLVENHPDTLQSLRLYLEDLGHTVVSAQTLAETLRLLPSASCQILLCDIGLPDGTGWEVLEKTGLRDKIFGIAMSGFGMRTDSVKSRTAGFHRHLVKPFKLAELEEALEEAAADIKPS